MVVEKQTMSVEQAMVSTMIELVDSTPVAENLLVTSFKKSYLYGEFLHSLSHLKMNQYRQP